MSENSDQMAMRLKDLYRLRELIRVHGRNGELRIASLPEPQRTEAEQLLDRIGELDSEKRRGRGELLLDLALLETYLDAVMPTPQNAAEIQHLRRGISHERSMLTGLPEPEDERQ